MEKIKFGKTGLLVTRVAMGGIPIMRLKKKDAARVVRKVIDLGVNFIDTANGYGDSEEKAAELGRQGLVLIHPFDDPRVVAGQGTIGQEIDQQAVSDLSSVIVPVGGGGLIAGVALGLKDRATHKPAELSGGQRQRVTIARALANHPKIVWADEPTGDLDSDNSKEIIDLMIRLNRENGQTFVMVTHDPKIGKRAARRIWMDNGQITKEENGRAK